MLSCELKRVVLAGTLTLMTVSAVSGQSLLGIIAATVNDRLITVSELEARLDLRVLEANLPNSLPLRQQLVPLVLRQLIDERLRQQAISDAGIAVTSSEVEAALADLAQRNNLTLRQFEMEVTRTGVPWWTLQEHIRVDLGWRRLIQQRFQPQIRPSEVDAVQERLLTNVGQSEYRLREIFLPLTSTSEEDSVYGLAQELVLRLRHGSDFATLARQFSQAAGQGGDLGWVQRGQLAAPLDQQLAVLMPGQVSEPIRSSQGYHILLLQEHRLITAGGEVVFSLRRAVLSRSSNPIIRQTALARATDLQRQVANCQELDQQLQQNGLAPSESVEEVPLNELAEQLGLDTLPVGLAAELINLPEETLLTRAEGATVTVWMVCQRTIAPSTLPSRTEITQQLVLQRIGNLQRRFLQQLRRGAVIDIRIGLDAA